MKPQPPQATISAILDDSRRPWNEAEIVRAVQDPTLAPRNATTWAKLLGCAESTLSRILRKHKITLRSPRLKKDQVIEALTASLKAGHSKTAREWAKVFKCHIGYVERLARQTQLEGAIRGSWKNLFGTISIAHMKGEGGLRPYRSVMISTRMLRIAGLEAGEFIAYRIDPEKKQIILEPASPAKAAS